MSSPEIVIINAYRTPIGNFNGYFKDIPTPELGAFPIRACYKKAGLTTAQIDAVNMGCVLSAGLGQAPARQAALKAGLPITTACTTINKMCASGLEALTSAHDKIKAGTHQLMIAGGMENMTRAPYLIPKARFGYRYGHAQMLDHMQKDGLEDAYDQQSMGLHAEKCAGQYAFTRAMQDAFALDSLKKAQHATQCAAFQNEIIPIQVGTETITQDEGPLTIKAEKIPLLRAAFASNGTITAANASSISDGAAAITLTTLTHSQQLNLKPMAKVVGHFTYAGEPHWFTTAPIYAITGLLKKINWSLNDVDLFEINEAFACVTMATLQELKIPQHKSNINGGACVLGHPIGASGARIVVTLIHALQSRGLKKGIASLCIGGGEAQAIAIELI